MGWEFCPLPAAWGCPALMALGSVDWGAFWEDKFRSGRRWWEVPHFLLWYLLPLPRNFSEILGWEGLWRARIQPSPQKRINFDRAVQGFPKLNFNVSTEGDCSIVSQGHCFGNESLPWQSFSVLRSGWSFPRGILKPTACALSRARAPDCPWTPRIVPS